MAAIGIDLGTTNSAVAYFDGRRARVLKTRLNEPLTPSVVSYRSSKNGEGEILVGRTAVNNAELAPLDTIFSIKRLMGRSYDDPKVQELREKVSYQILVPEADAEDRGVRVMLNETAYSPAEVSAMILKNLKEYAEFRLGKPVTHAVITVPAYFEERQRAATREAGFQAGLVVKMVMSEPVAAALAFGLESTNEEGHRALVFDLGGGTFDISIIQMFGDQFQVLYHGGDNWLGGDDFDREIVALMVKHVKKEQGFDPSGDPVFQFRAKQKAQEAKIALCGQEEYEIILNPAGTSPKGEPFALQMVLTRKKLESTILKYVDKCIELTRQALEDQDFTQDDISEILLVGGSTAIPLIQKRLSNEFSGITIKSDIDPMECVALGAAILAAKLKGVECPQCYENEDEPDEKKRRHTLNDESATECKKCGASLAAARAAGDIGYTDITAMHLGIRAVKGENLDAFVPIIPKGTRYPLEEPKRETFYTVENNQKLIKIPVFEGERDIASQNDQQGIVEWQLPEELPINTPVEVAFNFDRNRVLTVAVRVMGRDDLAHEVTLQRDRPTVVIEASSDEEEVDWREELDHIIPTAEWFIQNLETYMKEGTANKMRNDIERLRTALDEGNQKNANEAAHDIYLTMIGGAGVASQLYLAERAAQGAPPEVAAEIQEAAEELREAYDLGNNEQQLQKVRELKPKIARQLQSRMGQPQVGEKIDFGDLLRYKG